ncbi:hypothetical protein LXA43DRAFT_922134 [Ganoderma leucocontextum]|nr:hypothetical protein LXA43DRAFT_922134 [Ganoderma leucocontextum]
MPNQEIYMTPRLWSCNWNWCPETFRDSRDLRTHLQETHYNNILQVKKRDWDTYLRSTEGRSGATDSLLAAIPDPAQFTQSSSQDRMDVDEPPRRSASGSLPPRRSISGSVPHRSPLPMTPPPVPPFPRNNRRTSGEIRAEHQHPRATYNAYPSPGQERLTNSPSSSQLSDAKRRRMSFASYRAQSSPMSTPSVASVPPSPSLANMVADAINQAGQLNEASPARPHGQSQSRKPDSAAAAIPPLPRRTSFAASPTGDRPRSYPSRPTPTSSFHSQSPASPTKRSSANSPDTMSVGSAQSVEDALTQNVFSSASSHAPNDSSQSSGAGSSISSSPRKHRQSQPSSQPSTHSYGGSHAVGSYPQTQPPLPPGTQTKADPLPDVKPNIADDADPTQELAYPHSSLSSSPAEAPAPPEPTPPLPRRRTRSKTPAQPPPVAPTRTLRSQSQSKTSAPPPPPAASQSKTLPLPRSTRSRAASQTDAGAAATPLATTAAAAPKGQRATSKPPSAGKRAGSAGPTAGAGGRKGTRANAGGLAAVDEQPDEASQPAATQTQAQRPPTFRSGTLQLPRLRHLQASQAQSQSQSQAQTQIAAATAGRFGEEEGLDVKVKRELLDAEPLPSESQSQDGGVWTGFELNPMELLTQKPFPSQSQGWGSSQ